MRFFRAPMSAVTMSSSEAVSATSRSTRVCGITPSVRAPPARAAVATAPIMPTQPPPDTSVCPRAASSAPVRVARSSQRRSRVLDEAQKTQTAATSPLPAGFGQRRVGGQDDLDRLVDVVGQLDQVEVLRTDLPLGQQCLLDPVEQATPVRRTHEDHW